ncbi:hypothetical protein BaRGS_00029883 [Batillaria attramentaria]|uniref:Uncharacterized protein n=1 Tax=Batillaria attramentaria TaxID=370345 RepID=A0ABD0JVB7_9CAEN
MLVHVCCLPFEPPGIHVAPTKLMTYDILSSWFPKAKAVGRKWVTVWVIFFIVCLHRFAVMAVCTYPLSSHGSLNPFPILEHVLTDKIREAVAPALALLFLAWVFSYCLYQYGGKSA